MERVLLFGGSGILGTEILRVLQNEKFHYVAPRSSDVDIRDKYQVIALVQKFKPTWIINCAAWTNVDDAENLKSILDAIMKSTLPFPVIFPVHPRTKQILKNIQLDYENLIMIEPQGYLEFIYLVKHAKGIITDSGGITEEATVLHVPCLTMRNSTERPETITLGTNELIGDDLEKLKSSLIKIMDNNWKKGTIPPLWDGKTAERIVDILVTKYL